jgi:PrgI family protein
MRFAVPQFIDVEDKLFGPLTLRQAIYLAGGVGAVLVSFSWFGALFGILIGLPIALLSFALAFVKINNRPFSFMVYAAVFYAVRNKLYLWKRVASTRIATTKGPTIIQKHTKMITTPQLTQSRLKELAWSLDTHDTLYTNENQWK